MSVKARIHLIQQNSAIVIQAIFCSLFYDAFSVTRLYSVDDRVKSE
jgi:hypothetical protein